MLTTPQHQYLTNWHDDFVNYIGSLLTVITELISCSESSEKDKKGLECIKLILNGRSVSDVERDLSFGIVKKSTLENIAKINKDLADTCLEHIQINPLVRDFWKQMSHIRIECDKASEKERLAALQIPVMEG